MRVLVDYRPALKERSGVGEYVHQFVGALLATFSKADLDLSLFSSSWKDRFQPSAELAGATAIDRRMPGKLLNFAWHRLGWPPAEVIAGRSFDVAHSLHPLLLPGQDAARVITIQIWISSCTPSGRAPKSAATTPRSPAITRSARTASS